MENDRFIKEERTMFMRIVERFEYEIKWGIKGRIHLISKDATQSLERKYKLELILYSTNEVQKRQNEFRAIKPNQIILEASKNYPYYHLFRHLRNCAAHPEDNIYKLSENGVEYYKFEDKKGKMITLSALIPVDKFEDYINEIYENAEKFRNKRN